MTLQGKNILVTGASGRLGQQIIYELSKLGLKPVAQVRSGSNCTFLDSLGLEKRETDLRSREALSGLTKGIDYVIHTAAIVNFRQDRFTQFAGVNTMAAVDLFNAAQKNGVKRFLHISTVAAVGGVPRTKNSEHLKCDTDLANEEFEFNLSALRIPYIMTKHAAETELFKLAENSQMELVIVNPSIVIAPSRGLNDRAKAKKMLKRLILPDLPNRLNLVDIRDCAKGIVAALTKGRPGNRYILGGDNITARELALAASTEVGVAPHLLRLPKSFYKVTSRLAVTFGTLMGKSKISYYPDLVRLLDYDWAFSSKKARDEFGYKSRSIYTSLKDLLNNKFLDTYLKPTKNNNKH